MPKRPVRYEKQKKARERALKERKALSYEDVPLKQYDQEEICLLYTSPSPRDAHESRMPSSA